MAAPATAVSALRKAGNLNEALVMARSGFAQAPQDAFLQRAYGWVIYDLVKREVRLYEADEIPAGRLANRFSEWLADYERLDLIDRPGLLHSLLLTQILKGGRVWQGFLRFARWWDPKNLRDEDKQPYKNEDGKLLPNLEMRLLYAMGRTAVSQNDDPELREWAEGTLDQGLQQHPNDLVAELLQEPATDRAQSGYRGARPPASSGQASATRKLGLESARPDLRGRGRK